MQSKLYKEFLSWNTVAVWEYLRVCETFFDGSRLRIIMDGNMGFVWVATKIISYINIMHLLPTNNIIIYSKTSL